MCSETFSICLNMSVKLRMTPFSCKINNFWLNLSNINRYIFSSFAFVWKSNFKCVKYTSVIMELPFSMGITLVLLLLQMFIWNSSTGSTSLFWRELYSLFWYIAWFFSHHSQILKGCLCQQFFFLTQLDHGILYLSIVFLWSMI